MNEIFNLLSHDEHEQLCFFKDPHSGLKAIIAIHDTTLGPALGGCRMWPYVSESDAIKDALRLSQGMTYKAAVAGLNLGGGKAVIIGNSKTDKSELLFRSFGRFIEGLGGRYITAEDVGTSTQDMEHVLMETNYVTGLSHSLGGSGDPSPVTAYGVYQGIKACVMRHLGKDKLKGIKVAVQGLGHVGMHLTRLLSEDGCSVFVCDLDPQKLDFAQTHYKAQIVPLDSIFELDVDVLSPAALGGILNEKTIPQLKCKIVAGPANNQLLDYEKDAQRLQDRHILYAPDYVINSGGLINVANEIEGYNQTRAFQRTEGIYDTLMHVFELSQSLHITTMEAANYLAKQRLKHGSFLKKIYAPSQKQRQHFSRLHYHIGG